MKKQKNGVIKKSIFVIFLCCVFMLFFSAMGATTPAQQQASIGIVIGEKIEFNKRIEKSIDLAKIKYTLSDKTIATIDQKSVLKGVDLGETVLQIDWIDPKTSKKRTQKVKIVVQAPANTKVFKTRQDVFEYIKKSSSQYDEKLIFTVEIDFANKIAQAKQKNKTQKQIEKEMGQEIENLLPKAGEIKGIFLKQHVVRCLYNLEANHVDFSYKLSYSSGAKVMKSILQEKQNQPQLVKLNKTEQTLKEGIYKIINELDLNSSAKTKKQKALELHDYMVLKYEYDIKKTQKELAHEAYGLINSNKGVCQAYSEIYFIALNAVGVECKYVIGSMGKDTKDENHSWNKVKLDDGLWVNVDVTSDDPVPDKKGRVMHKFFALTDEQLSATHNWEK